MRKSKLKTKLAEAQAETTMWNQEYLKLRNRDLGTVVMNDQRFRITKIWLEDRKWWMEAKLGPGVSCYIPGGMYLVLAPDHSIVYRGHAKLTPVSLTMADEFSLTIDNTINGQRSSNAERYDLGGGVSLQFGKLG